IAEAGVNHNGELASALGLVDAAAHAGANVVKFQTFSADRLVTFTAAKAGYQVPHGRVGETQHELLSRLELSRADHEALIARAREHGIEFLSTGFDEQSVDMLIDLGAARLKIPSGEITNLPYLRHVGGRGLPVILSTGMSDLDEVSAALRVLESSGAKREEVTVLHCTTAYPTPSAEANLRAMATMAGELGVRVGYSDHTMGHEIAVAAVALGACVIEKHLTLDRTATGPDHAASLEPGEFAELVRAIRSVEQALGDGTKVAQPSEIANMVAARRSLVTVAPIRAGELFSGANIAAKRPGSGLSPMRWDDVIGTPAPRDFAVDELVER
ncbi:MAG: N-acetylneuraminate synthase, partial [bacterium]|nr:N-acetylneuraminate synthase [bacterium]